MRRKRRTPNTIVQWRQDKGRCANAFKILESEIMQEMLAIVEKSSPLHGPTLSFGIQVSEHDHSRHLGRIEGYQMAITALESLAAHNPLPKEPKATYSPPEE